MIRLLAQTPHSLPSAAATLLLRLQALGEATCSAGAVQASCGLRVAFAAPASTRAASRLRSPHLAQLWSPQLWRVRALLPLALGAPSRMGQKRKQPAGGNDRPKRQLRQHTLTQAGPAGGRTSGRRQQKQQHKGPGAGITPQLQELRVVSVRQAMRGGGFRATFERDYAGWTVSSQHPSVSRCAPC